VVDREPEYVDQLLATARAVAGAATLAPEQWSFVYQSAGHTPEEWLKPDMLEVLPQLAAAGHTDVIVAPVQFLADHLETLYDIDIAGREQALSAGIGGFTRIDAPNSEADFVAALAKVVQGELAVFSTFVVWTLLQAQFPYWAALAASLVISFALAALIEAIMAFTGGQGAKSALTSLEKSDKSDPSYKHADTITGIGNYYGAHFEDTSTSTIGDLFVFSKGNDVFLIVAASTTAAVLSLATSQATSHFGSAPDSTILTSQWPENASPAASGGGALGGLILAVVIGIVIAIGVFVMRSRRRVAAPVGGFTPMSGYPMGAPPGSAMPGSASPVQAAPMAGGVQMSDDGYYWWDGQTWNDASAEAPPQAQRSADGAQWFDGKNWRPVPQGGQGPTG